MAEITLPSASEYAKKLAEFEASEAAKEDRARRKAEDDRKLLIEHLSAPSGVSDDEAIQRAIKVIEGAISRRMTEVQVYRFPNDLCTDKGRAINQQEPGWESTLTGIPKEIFLLWQRYFRDKGYGMRVEIIDFPNGMPGDVAMTLTWAHA